MDLGLGGTGMVVGRRCVVVWGEREAEGEAQLVPGQMVLGLHVWIYKPK